MLYFMMFLFIFSFKSAFFNKFDLYLYNKNKFYNHFPLTETIVT